MPAAISARRTCAAAPTPKCCSDKRGDRMPILESTLQADYASYSYRLAAGEPWLYTLKRGQYLRILDLEGNQAVDTLFYNSAEPTERYSAQDTIRMQGNLYL